MSWPSLPLEAWRDTCTTLHLWTQVVGKVRLRQSAWMNHSWHTTLYVTARGLSTSVMPHGERAFEIELDFVAHRLAIRASDGGEGGFALEPQTVAAFYRKLMDELARLNLAVKISTRPNEVAEAIAFDQDEVHGAYDPAYAHRYWQVLLHADRVFKVFRSRFVGKCSPVHYFWGAPDLAVTRFSGRAAPAHPGGVPNLPDEVAVEAYSQEVSSAGFWPGGGPVPHAAFYSYAYPEPEGLAAAPVRPAQAFYSPELREFLLPYDAVREAASPEAALLEFLQSTYEAAAERGGWARGVLERR